MSELSGKRVAGGKEAPTLFVMFSCSECGDFKTLDAYDGPPSCSTGHAKTFMRPRRLQEPVPDPLEGIREHLDEETSQVG